MTLVELNTTSIELRIHTVGICDCGIPYPTDNPPPEHDHYVECDWGRIEHTAPRPDRDEVGHLMICGRGYVDEALDAGGTLTHSSGATHSFTQGGPCGCICTGCTLADHCDSAACASVEPVLFAHVEYAGHRWTWELFEAHWEDGQGPDVYIGRWPD